ncbi:endonuclease/exonuclease/phosphatase family protein, partial [Hafnia paralvei]|uniref:endonuclease/exonuclease/phosphatase family protein n=1 Tax=Hafnia paralvei TaxID=546367 RepID=UPI0038D244EA
VLQDLTSHALLKQRNYQYIHFDSRDSRGVDVALLYQPKYFTPLESVPLFVPLPGRSKDAAFTRDILYVSGILDGERVHIYVNHWPSRRGGEARSSPAREAAARVCRDHFTRIQGKEPMARLIVMGDLNDNPDNKSITRALGAKG